MLTAIKTVKPKALTSDLVKYTKQKLDVLLMEGQG